MKKTDSSTSPFLTKEDLILLPLISLIFLFLKIGKLLQISSKFVFKISLRIFHQIRELSNKVSISPYQLALMRNQLSKFLNLRLFFIYQSLLSPFLKHGLLVANNAFRKLVKFLQKKSQNLILYLNNFRLPKIPKAPKLPKITLPKIKRLPHLLPGFFSYRSFLLGVSLTLLLVFLPYQLFTAVSSLPNPRLLTTCDLPVTTKIFDRNNLLLYEVYADQNRTPVKLTDLPPSLKAATISIEDKEFYSHNGLSWRGILRAAKETFFNHHLQGGSTLTQQLVRSALLTPEPTLKRKLKEIILSLWTEKLYSKDQILEMYFNQVPYGGTAWGIESAAQTYFRKSAKDLNLAESAYLAGLPSAPSVYSPFGSKPELGFLRQKEVLQQMQNQGFISEQEKNQALSEKLQFAPPQSSIKAPHFVMYVKDLLEKKYGARLVAMGGLRIITSLDLKIQEIAQEIVNKEINNLAYYHVGNGATLITDPKTGEILAMVGSKDYWNIESEGNTNVTLSLRQPGSSIKVVNYALALEKGFTPATLIDDSPVAFNIPGQPIYAPVNYDAKFHGLVTLRQALANSYNVPAVKTLAKLGVTSMIEKGRQMGISSWQNPSNYGLSLTLGGGEVTMLDMAKVYGTLANQGKRTDLQPILKITDYKGKTWEERKINSSPALSEEVAFLLSDILADDKGRSAAFGQNSLLNIPGKTVSVKTGTTNNLRDNWAIGYTPSYVVVSWVGNNDNTPMSGIASGITGATPIFHNIMTELLKDKTDEPYSPPLNIIKAEVCGRNEYFINGTQSSVTCPPPPPPTPTPEP